MIDEKKRFYYSYYKDIDTAPIEKANKRLPYDLNWSSFFFLYSTLSVLAQQSFGWNISEWG